MAAFKTFSRSPEDICKKINLGYLDPRCIAPEEFAGREEEGILLVPKAPD
jgi:lactate racemase